MPECFPGKAGEATDHQSRQMPQALNALTDNLTVSAGRWSRDIGETIVAKQTEFGKVPTELIVDASYRNTGNWKNPRDQFNKFFRFDGRGINNTSGFRAKSLTNGSSDIEDCGFCLLVTNYGETEWPDSLDTETGLFTYFGDNRLHGERLHETSIGGNRLLKKVFDLRHANGRDEVCPFLCFENYLGADGTYVRFLGLAVPGAEGFTNLDDLVAVWRRKGQRRFQNYKATFTILKTESVPRSWLHEIVSGVPPAKAKDCPPSFAKWVKTGKYDALTTPPDNSPRTKADQLPKGPRREREQKVLDAVRTLTDRQLEHFTKALLRLMDPRFFDLEVTREVVDGGRDVVGKYRVGHDDHMVPLTICAEAKHWKKAIGVSEMMRLISRIKHRDFGVFVTTSHFHVRVQEELIEDGHPIVLVSGGDLARILIARDLEGQALERWLDGIREEGAA